jgi:hypothetical protein
VKSRNFYWQRDADLSNEVWSGTSRVLGPMEKVKKREESRRDDGIIEIERVAPVKSSQYHELYLHKTVPWQLFHRFHQIKSQTLEFIHY